MSRIFLGRPIHWLITAALVAIGWIGGSMRFHVIEFNPFLLGLLAITVLAVLGVLKTSPAGTEVTRDPIIDDDEDDGEASSQG